jgi:hypothetical protein
MPTAGPTSPGTIVDDSSFGTSAWSNPGNAATTNTVYATNPVTPTGNSRYLKATNFGFAIPDGATIDGIEVAIRRKGLDAHRDARVRLVKAGTVQAADKAAAGGWSLSDVTVTYGGSGDPWSDTWSPADINDPGFGAVLSVTNISFKTPWQASVDSILITITYTEGAPAAPTGRRHNRRRLRAG